MIKFRMMLRQVIANQFYVKTKSDKSANARVRCKWNAVLKNATCQVSPGPLVE